MWTVQQSNFKGKISPLCHISFQGSIYKALKQHLIDIDEICKPSHLKRASLQKYPIISPVLHIRNKVDILHLCGRFDRVAAVLSSTTAYDIIHMCERLDRVAPVLSYSPAYNFRL